MAQIPSKLSNSKVISQLDTYNHTAALSSMYVVEVKMSEIPPSGLSIVIQQNGSTKLTSIAPAADQNHIDARIILNCAANDLISVILSSAVSSDTGPNAVKGILNIHPGSV